ncbi:MAG: peptidoglycan-binding domain-containing protein [Candidatus Paceibacterota bacterium]|jgi:peptidoglycan hydrolase-like protein with peptidoglycan-binding domain
MKKILGFLIVFSLLFVSIPTITKASTIDDLMAQVLSLQDKILNLQNQMSALVLRATTSSIIIKPVNTEPGGDVYYISFETVSSKCNIFNDSTGGNFVGTGAINGYDSNGNPSICNFNGVNYPPGPAKPRTNTINPISVTTTITPSTLSAPTTTSTTTSTTTKNILPEITSSTSKIVPNSTISSKSSIITLPSTTFKRTLNIGMSGSDVKNLQNILIENGYLPIGKNTGYYGLLTKSAVIKFQGENNISINGKFDSITSAKFLPTYTQSKTKQYKNNTYGIQFSYNGNFTLQEQTTNLGLPDDLACPNLFRIILTDPNSPDVAFDEGSPYVKPTIEINIRKASCYPDNTTILPTGYNLNAVLLALQPLLDLNQNTYTSFLQNGFSQKMSKTMAIIIPSRGDYPNGIENPPVWVNECTVGTVGQTNNNSVYIKNTDCIMNGGVIFIPTMGGAQQYFQTKVFIPSKSRNFFVDIEAGRDFYDITGHYYISQIISSFRFNSLTSDTLKLPTNSLN